MTAPCEQVDTIKEIKERAYTHNEKLHAVEVRQVEIQADVRAIKTKLENGMSHTIANLDTVLTKLEPIITHHSRIIGKIEDIGWWVSKTAITTLILAVVGISIWAIANGWQP